MSKRSSLPTVAVLLAGAALCWLVEVAELTRLGRQTLPTVTPRWVVFAAQSYLPPSLGLLLLVGTACCALSVAGERRTVAAILIVQVSASLVAATILGAIVAAELADPIYRSSVVSLLDRSPCLAMAIAAALIADRVRVWQYRDQVRLM